MEEYRRAKNRTRPARRTDYRRRLPRDTRELEQEQRLLFQAAVSFILVVITLGLVLIKTDFTNSFREKLKVGIAQQARLEDLGKLEYVDGILAKAEGFFSGLFPKKEETQGIPPDGGTLDKENGNGTEPEAEKGKGNGTESELGEGAEKGGGDMGKGQDKQTGNSGTQSNLTEGKNQPPPETTLPES